MQGLKFYKYIILKAEVTNNLRRGEVIEWKKEIGGNKKAKGWDVSIQWHDFLEKVKECELI